MSRREEGSGNENNQMFYGYNEVDYIDDDDQSLVCVPFDNRTPHQLILDPITSFKRSGHTILYTTRDGALYILTHDGQRQKILGGNGDKTAAYCANKKYFFVLLVGRNDTRTLYQLDLELKEAPKIVRSQVRIKGSLGADENYLYYIIQSDDVNKSSLIQYDIARESKKVIYNGVGIHAATVYRSYVVISTYQNFMDKKRGVALSIIDPRLMKINKLADIAANQLNCYLDHVFFVDEDTGYLWVAPLCGGGAHLIWNKPVIHFELCMACVHFWGPSDPEPRVMPLRGEQAFQVQEEGGISKEERAAFKFNMILLEEPEYYAKMSLSQALDYAMAEYDFDNEIFDYVVFLTKPSFNKHKENVNALLAAANYPAQRKPGSEPILFVDTTIFHGRSKGFVVATDGIYTKSKGFMLFDHTFTCEQKGIQNLDACLWKNDCYDDHPIRTLKLDLSLSRSKLDEVADLIGLVFIFSYFRKSQLKVDYTFPVPAEEPPPYIALQEAAPAPQAEKMSPRAKPPQTFPSKNKIDDKW